MRVAPGLAGATAAPRCRDGMDEFAADTGAASDEALLARFGQGDALAAQVLTARLAPAVLRFASRMLGGDLPEAEDVTQEALLRLWRHAPDWRPGAAPPAAWLYRVAANLCTDRLRRRLRRRDVALDLVAEPAAPGTGADGRMMAATRAAALQAALAQLPERQRQAVILRHIEGLANPEIAQIMETGVEAVESLTARGKRTLQASLAGRRQELGYEDEQG